MPYITAQQRAELASGKFPQDAGELNYSITQMLLRYLETKGQRYATFNEIQGVLACVSQEFYRRWTTPYEDRKKAENGDLL